MKRSLTALFAIASIGITALMIGCAHAPAKTAANCDKPTFTLYDSWGVTNTVSDRSGVVTNVASNGNMMRQVDMPGPWVMAGPHPFVGAMPLQPPWLQGSVPTGPTPPPAQPYCFPGFKTPPWMRHNP